VCKDYRFLDDNQSYCPHLQLEPVR
jgi:hypothetical protein